MYQWRKFEFFEEKTTGKSSSSSMPDEVTGKTECCSSGRGKIVVGSDDGMVTLLDRGFKHIYGFQAHASYVLLLQQLKQRNHLMTIGEDEQISLQLSPICLKVFDLDKKQPEGTSTTSPDCIQILRIFTNQFPEAKITTFLVLEEAPPIMLISIGLNNGCIYCIKGDIAREGITRFKLQVENTSEKNQSAITGLGYWVDGQALQLFAVTSASVTLFNLHEQPPRRQTLDQIGSEVNSVTMSDRSEETVAMRKEIQDLRTNARIFQLSKCTACTFTLDLPAVHFMCMHSFHQRCLGDNEKECPECAPEHGSVVEMKKSLEQNGRDQDWFFSQVKSSKDGFSVIAEYFGKGVVSKTSNGTLDNLRSGTSSQSGF